MADQISREMADYRWPPFITDRDPPIIEGQQKTYLVSCIDADGHAYVKTNCWYKSWQDPSAFVTIVGWMEAPEPLLPQRRA